MQKLNNWQIIILAAGKSSRMNSKKHKSLVVISGKNLLTWCCELVKKISGKNPIVLLGYQAEKVKKYNPNLNVSWVIQEQLGGGTAKSLFDAVNLGKIKTDNLLILYVDDAFLYSAVNIANLCRTHETKKNVLTLLTFRSKVLPIGGVVRDEDGIPEDTVSCDGAKEKGIEEVDILCGAIALDRRWFMENFDKITANYKGEKGLPELINIAYKQKAPLSSYPLGEGSYWQGVNTKQELVKARSLKLKQLKK